MENGVCGIYEIVNLVNGKRYVGSATDIRQRWREHRSMLSRGKHHNRHLQNAWSKYGAESFEFRLIRTCQPIDLVATEQLELDDTKPVYNVCLVAGSTLGRLHSEETRQKISKARMGSKMPERDAEYRAKISAAHKGKPKSKEHLAALQEGRRKFVRSEADRKKVSESLIRAYREGRKRRDRPQEYRDKIAAGLRRRHREMLSIGQINLDI